MDCVSPVLAWRTGTVRCKSDGQLSPKIEFSPRRAESYFRSRFGVLWLQAMNDAEMRVACGKCPNCLHRKRALKSVQLCHERSLHEKACFITLTYDEKHCPTTDYRPIDDPNKVLTIGVCDDACVRTLLPYDVQCFVKRLRRHLEYVPKRKKELRDHVEHIRYFLVGEYGTKTGRPHYHLIIFGWFPSDAKVWKGRDYLSDQIAKLWKFGHHLVSEVTEGTCKYCAQYVTKKLVKRSSPLDGRRVPEFTYQSCRGGGMGVPWLLKYARHCAAVGYVTFRSGRMILKSSFPPAYVRALRKYYPTEWLDWRSRCLAHRAPCLAFNDAVARAKLRLVQFAKSVDREKL